jgi:hypothetical protein
MSQGIAAAPVLPLKIILPHFAEFCIPRIDSNSLRKTLLLQKANSDASRLLLFVTTQNFNPMFYREFITLARAFEYPRNRVTSTLEHCLDLPGHRAKHIALDRDREWHLVDVFCVSFRTYFEEAVVKQSLLRK